MLEKLREKKEMTETNLSLSFWVTVLVIVMEILAIVLTFKITWGQNILTNLFGVAIVLFLLLTLYLTIDSYIKRIEIELRHFWNCVYIALEHEEPKNRITETRVDELDLGDHIPRID